MDSGWLQFLMFAAVEDGQGPLFPFRFFVKSDSLVSTTDEHCVFLQITSHVSSHMCCISFLGLNNYVTGPVIFHLNNVYHRLQSSTVLNS